MKLLVDLFSSPVGLMSLLTIVLIIAIGVFMLVFVLRKVAEEEHQKTAGGPGTDSKQPH